MQRRDFLGFTAIVGGGMFLSACNSSNAAAALADTTSYPKPEGAVTYYAEIRVPGPENPTVLGKIDELITAMAEKTGYLSISFKQMTGESTMVKNYPDNKKGILDRGFAKESDTDGVPGQPTSTKIPYFYSLFVRFDKYDNMVASGVQEWFKANIVPSLFAYNASTTPPTKTSIALDYYEGVFVTVAAGDRNAIYTEQAEILNFLQNQADEVGQSLVTVENHVMIKDANLNEFNEKVKNLLTTAQNTFRPDVSDADYDPNFPYGQEGTADNTYYRKAVTTEILQNAFPDGGLRAYLMHGVWESMYDHENSHIDVRFQQAAGPVGAYVVVGPVEPFYDTIKQDGIKEEVPA